LHESHYSGDLGYALCTVKAGIPPAGQATGTDGTTITVWDATIWQRDPAGRWRIVVDISTPWPPGRR
jgi:ketosteroid isomerase-like protein